MPAMRLTRFFLALYRRGVLHDFTHQKTSLGGLSSLTFLGKVIDIDATLNLDDDPVVLLVA